mgnify:CR=1 FL=1
MAHAATCSRGWSDGPATGGVYTVWWVVGQGGVVRQDVIRVQVPGGQTHAAQQLCATPKGANNEPKGALSAEGS